VSDSKLLANAKNLVEAIAEAYLVSLVADNHAYQTLNRIIDTGSSMPDGSDEDEDMTNECLRVFGRPGYEIAPEHPLPRILARAAEDAGCRPGRVGMSFWTDAAVLHAAGIPTVLFGPGGAGLHGPEEYVRARDVCLCRDVLVSLVRQVTRQL
jgi:acetylornithine deacetylase